MSNLTDFFPSSGGGVSWQTTPKTSDFTAVNGEGYFVDSTSATPTALTVTLPSSPSVGDLVSFIDYGGDSTLNPIVFTSSDNIEGGAADKAVQYNNGAIQLVFSGATKGWLSAAASATGALSVPITGVDVEFLVLAGGGGSISTIGATYYRGGGGAGGLRTSTGSTYSGGSSVLENAINLDLDQPYTITVGAGGAAATGIFTNNQGNGSDTTFASITSIGGGGANYSSSTPGGCGSGSGYGGTVGGAGTAGQGFSGGGNTSGTGTAGSGGGGTASIGIGNSGMYGGNGGDGTNNNITLSFSYYGAGGGGMRGGSTPNGPGADGTGWTTSRAQTGHGGAYQAGAGGSGVIILKWLATYTATFSAGVVHTTTQVSWNGALHFLSVITGGAADTVSFEYTG